MTPLFRLSCASVVFLHRRRRRRERRLGLRPQPVPPRFARPAGADGAAGGYPGVGPDAGDPNDPAEMVVRLNRLENELRQANGRIEELENQQRLLQDQLRRFQQDVEYRLGGAAPPPSGAAPVASAPPVGSPPVVAAAPGAAATELAPGAKPRRGDAFDPNADPNAPGAPRPLGRRRQARR